MSKSFPWKDKGRIEWLRLVEEPQPRKLADGTEEPPAADAVALWRFELGYAPRSRAQALRMLDELERARKLETLDAQAAVLVPLYRTFFSTWRHCTPEALRALMGQWVDDDVFAAMRAEVAETDGVYPWSPERFGQVLDDSTALYWLLIEALSRLGAQQIKRAADRGNALPSGASTDTPEATTVTPTTSADGPTT